MIYPDTVIRIYRSLLSREPENIEVVKYHCDRWESEDQLVSAILQSSEFKTKVDYMEATRNGGGQKHWHKYASKEYLSSELGLEIIAFQEYAVTSSNPHIRIRSMLMPGELALLYHLAKDKFTSEGVIIDAGPLLGLSSYLFMQGLMRNKHFTQKSNPTVYSYDLFRCEGDYTNYFKSLKRNCATPNLLHEFLLINSQYIPHVLPHQGDFLTWKWEAKQLVEILFLDLAKSWELNHHAIVQYFPALIPEKSTLVQQDYVHFVEYWIPITMEYFSDEFHLEGFAFGATAYFTLKKEIPAKKLQLNLKDISYSDKMALLEQAREKAPPTVKEVLKCSLAKCAFDHGNIDEAYEYIGSVKTDVCESDAFENFSPIAVGNRIQMLEILENASSSS